MNTQSFEFRAMGSQISVMLEPEITGWQAALRVIPGWFEAWEASLSRFRPESELNRLNAANGQWFSTSPELWAVLQAACAAADLSGSLVLPTVLPALEQAGYTHSFDSLAADSPAGVHPANPALPPELKTVAFNDQNQSVRLPAGVRLDLGGVGKGWAAQQALQRLAPYGPALVNAGGDIAVGAAPRDAGGWTIGIVDPLNPEQDLLEIVVEQCGVATSGRDHRRWKQAGKAQHHIIDPRSGQPAETDLISVTILAADVLQAEAAAKAVFILGSQAGLDWLAQQPAFAGVLVFENGNIEITPNLWAWKAEKEMLYGEHSIFN